METIYLLLPIIGAFVFLFLGCCFGRKMKEMLHIPKQVVLGRAVMQRFPGVRIQEDSDSDEDECPTIRVKFRDQRGRQLTGVIPSSASRDSVVPSSCSDSGVALLSASRQSIPPGTSISGLLKRRYLDMDNAGSSSRLSLDSAIHTSRTYNFSQVDSEEEEPLNIDGCSATPRRMAGLLVSNSQIVDPDDLSDSVPYGPPNWDHVVILHNNIDSLPNNITPGASSVTMVTDSQQQHSFSNVQTLYDSGLMIRQNPLSWIQSHSVHSLQDVRFSQQSDKESVSELPDHRFPRAKRLSTSMCSLNHSNLKDLGRPTADSGQHRDHDKESNGCVEDIQGNLVLCDLADKNECDNNDESLHGSAEIGSVRYVYQIEHFNDNEDDSTDTVRYAMNTALENAVADATNSTGGTAFRSTNITEVSNGNTASVEPPGVFPLLTGVATLVDNMKEAESASFRKVSGSLGELYNNNCCIEVGPASDQTRYNNINAFSDGFLKCV